ncbi:MAG: phosphodiester glycosidase family protein [Bacteroidota bacterium]|nr:phosphodiester glycosidase family protein [Bacteroidota bacterium]
MKIINTTLALAIIFCFFACSSFLNCKHGSSTKEGISSSMPYDSLSGNGITVYNFKKYNTSIISISGTLNFIYNPVNPKSLNEIGKAEGWNILINASYYAGSANNARHVGILNIYGRSIAQKEYDKQLTHVIRYNKKLNNIYFFDYKDYSPVNDSSTLEIQTGPLVIEDSKLATGYIEAAINGKRNAERTLLAATENRQLYFIIVRDKVNLIDLGNYLLTLQIFANKKLDVMNLDGGPSTTLFSRDYPQINFKDDTRLPFLLGVK